VEPDTFAFGATVVGTYQVGRFFNGGASDIGYARSSDGGASWDVSSFLPGLTFNAGPFANPDSPFERVSDPSVAFDARHGTWMISSIRALLRQDGRGPAGVGAAGDPLHRRAGRAADRPVMIGGCGCP
jgi:hypothetical protein